MLTLRLDNSTLSATRKCATLAATRYHLGLTTGDETAPMRAGTGVHEGVAAYFQSGGDVDAALAGLDRSYRAWSEERVPPDDRLGYRNVAKILQRWCWAHPLADLPFTVDPSLVEVGAQALLTEDGVCLCNHEEDLHASPGDACSACSCPEYTIVIYQGRLDSVPQGRDGRWYVGDVKTTGQIKAEWLKGFELSSQFTGYAWLVRETVKKPVAGAFVLAIELGLLPGSTRKCATHKLPYAECSMAHAKFAIVHTLREPWMLEEWRKGALILAQRYAAIRRLVPAVDAIQAVRQEGMWTDACARCELFPWCKSGRTKDMADALLTYQPWRPFEPPEAALTTQSPKEAPP
jgi:hypothetical protein